MPRKHERVFEELYVIECRDHLGALDLTAPQPETVFGMKAITGITTDEMAKAVWRHNDDAVMDGRFISRWPAFVDPRFSARRKTW